MPRSNKEEKDKKIKRLSIAVSERQRQYLVREAGRLQSVAGSPVSMSKLIEIITEAWSRLPEEERERLVVLSSCESMAEIAAPEIEDSKSRAFIFPSHDTKNKNED